MNVVEPGQSQSSGPLPGVVDSAANGTHAHTGSAVAQKLRAAIMDGRLRPGAKLSEQSLGEALGVSRNTLREAFAALGAERIITRIPNRGVFVAKPSFADVQEMYRIRRVLEPAALLRDRRPGMGSRWPRPCGRGSLRATALKWPGWLRPIKGFTRWWWRWPKAHALTR